MEMHYDYSHPDLNEDRYDAIREYCHCEKINEAYFRVSIKKPIDRCRIRSRILNLFIIERSLRMKGSLKILSIIAALSAFASAIVGIFYSDNGAMRIVDNIYGQQITLYGDGIYANNSILKVGTTKGTDIVIIAVSITLLAILIINKNKKACMPLQSGLLLIILYDTICLIMGVSFNRLFLLYVLQFGSSLFAFILSVYHLMNTEIYQEQIYKKHLICAGSFMLISGCSVLIWLTFILPAVITGQPLDGIGIYTTEPVYAIDLAIVLPSYVFCGVALLKKKKVGYRLAPVLLTFITGVGLCVISQTIYQKLLGIVLPDGQLFGLVGSFIVLGIFAAVLNIQLLKFAKV